MTQFYNIIYSERAFEESNIQSIKFASDGNLSAIYDYAFQKTNDWKSGVAIPRSLSSWGRYAFHNSNVPSIIFESPSKINTFPTYSFAYLQTLTYLELPKGVAGFSGSGQTISYCSSLKTLKLPNTFSLVIQAYHIRDNEELTEIILENGWNCSANFSNCNNLTSSSMVAMFNALKNLTGQTSKTLTLGSTNLSKLTSSQIAIATSKNWNWCNKNNLYFIKHLLNYLLTPSPHLELYQEVKSMAKITVIPPTINPLTRLPNSELTKRKVAGYARVSTDSDEQFTTNG